MNLKKLAVNLIIFLVILSIPIITYIGSFLIVFNNQNFYKEEFKALNIYTRFPENNIDAINTGLLNYLKYGKTNEYFDSSFFSDKEKKHLADVKNTIQNAILIFYVLIIADILLLALLFFTYRELFFISLFQMLSYGGIFTLLIGFLLLFTIYYSFDLFFYYFHLPLFGAESWLFDPADNIVNLYPDKFFSDFGVRIFIAAIIISVSTTLIAFIFPPFAKKETD